jgi:hypothetical protein
MGVTEQQRHSLLSWFEEQMGPERAATMMELIPPAGAAELVTRRDLGDLERRLDARLEAMRSSMMSTFGTWLSASQAAVIAAISLVVALS